jgi:hypothetical protein
MDCKIIGKFSNKEYNAKDAIRILDPVQAALYWNNGVVPLDIFPSRDYETNKALIVYVFKRSETKQVFDLWCKHELT